MDLGGVSGIERAKQLVDDKFFIGFTTHELRTIRALVNVRATNLEAVSARELSKNPLMTHEKEKLLPVYKEVVRKISDRLG